MYRYDEFDITLVRERVTQFRDQVARRLSGELTEEQFKHMRLMNGLYLQLHAYMLRVAIPYGTLSAVQMRQLAMIARRWDRGYGHFTTRQNIQYNWPALVDTPDILDALADVEMHAIQTSGNCIRNITTDPFAGAAADEVEDPRPLCELLRQWSTFHPEFSYLPRKFKIAVTAAPTDRAAILWHDIGLRLLRNDVGEIGVQVFVGGGQGRTPVVGKEIAPFVPKDRLLAYLEGVMRVYNAHGRRDNKYKARIKILVNDLGIDAFREQVEAAVPDQPEALDKVGQAELARIEDYFAAPDLPSAHPTPASLAAARAGNKDLDAWVDNNVHPHKEEGYGIVTISLKPEGGIPGDASAEQMEVIADLADRYSQGEIRVTYTQNLVLPHVSMAALSSVHEVLQEHGLAPANAGLITDIIACPGMDYCSLATARSIPVAQRISTRFADLQRQRDIGPLRINISGCINACGHHHAGHIGILGLDRNGEENYQITLGGAGDETASLGKILGPGFSGDAVEDAIEAIVDTYLAERQEGETFLQAVRRLGVAPFKEAAYGRA